MLDHYDIKTVMTSLLDEKARESGLSSSVQDACVSVVPDGDNVAGLEADQRTAHHLSVLVVVLCVELQDVIDVDKHGAVVSAAVSLYAANL